MNLSDAEEKNVKLINNIIASIQTCNKKGLIIHGPPGCGKMYILTEALSKMNKVMRVLNVGDRHLLSYQKVNQINPFAFESDDNVTTYVIDRIDDVKVGSKEYKSLDVAFQHLFFSKPIILISYDLNLVPKLFMDQSSIFEVNDIKPRR